MDPKFQRRKRLDSIFKYTCVAMMVMSIAVLFVLLYHITLEGYDFISTKLITNFQSRFAEKSGIKAGIHGTLWLITLTATISIPIGIGAAMFLEEYGVKGKLGKFIELNISNLAGVPSIVYGLLGLTVFVRYWGFNHSILSGAMTLALLIMPVIIVATREAIKSVPDSIRYAAYGMGAAKWHVVVYHVLPIATPGILTGVILALSRAIGETAPLIIVGALTYIAYVPETVMDEFTVLPIQIYSWASKPQVEFHHLAAAGIIVLLSVMLVMNFIAVVIRNRSQKRNKI